MTKKELELKIMALEKENKKLNNELSLANSKLYRRDKKYRQHHFIMDAEVKEVVEK